MKDSDFDTNEARAVLQAIDDSDSWQLDTDLSTSGETEARIGESRARPVHSRYENTDTDGHLAVSVPAPTGEVANLLLVNPLDVTLAESSGEFATALGKEHSRRADRFCQQYFDPLENSNLVAQANIPSGFNRAYLRSELLSIHTASQRVDDLHDKLWSLVTL